jgi:Family of unknown function (DUF5690)
MPSPITRMLSRGGPAVIAAYALAASFTTYFCMYAFRKPFAVASYAAVPGWFPALDFKVTIVIAQVLGYALSKAIGIKLISEARAGDRARMILLFVALSEAALVAFAVVPAPLKVVAIFFSALPLGMIWGLVFGYLEGRRSSEWLGTGLCLSFIVSSGVVKSAGRSLIDQWEVPEFWMPAATGGLFLPLLMLSVWLLAQTPPPDARDRAERMPRGPMSGAERGAFWARAGMGLVLLIIAYVALTALRDFRDNFAVELWHGLGYDGNPALFTLSELPVAAFILLLFGATAWIRSNQAAVIGYLCMILAGAVVIAGATFAWQCHWIGAMPWMIGVGAGVYMGYIPFNAVLADRLTAAMGIPGNAAFFMYLTDASGYGGSVALLLVKSLGVTLSWLSFFVAACYLVALTVGVATLLALLHFHFDTFRRSARPPHPSAAAFA